MSILNTDFEPPVSYERIAVDNAIKAAQSIVDTLSACEIVGYYITSDQNYPELLKVVNDAQGIVNDLSTTLNYLKEFIDK